MTGKLINTGYAFGFLFTLVGLVVIIVQPYFLRTIVSAVS
jgi:hypothetical protein